MENKTDKNSKFRDLMDWMLSGKTLAFVILLCTSAAISVFINDIGFKVLRVFIDFKLASFGDIFVSIYFVSMLICAAFAVKYRNQIAKWLRDSAFWIPFVLVLAFMVFFFDFKFESLDLARVITSLQRGLILPVIMAMFAMSDSSRQFNRFYRGFFSATRFVLVWVIVTEVFVRLLFSFVPALDKYIHPVQGQIIDKSIVPDLFLDYRPTPNFNDNDELGWRNASVLKKADIVVMGDSQTYGTHVKQNEAWPAQLAQFSGKTVYNIAYGGYCLMHERLLLDEALSFDPDMIIFTIYTGNDLFDVYKLSYLNDLNYAYRNTAPEIVKQLYMLESANPLGMKDWARIKNIWNDYAGIRRYDKELLISLPFRFSDYLLSAEIILKFANKIIQLVPDEIVWDDVTKTILERYPDMIIVKKEPITCMAPFYRLAALDDSDLRIIDAKRITFKLIEEVNQIAKEKNIKIAFAIIPTKMNVYKKFLDSNKIKTNSFFDSLIRNENIFIGEIKNKLEMQSIPYFEVLPVLEKAVMNTERVYFTDFDGHPNPYGHRLIAEQANIKVRELFGRE